MTARGRSYSMASLLSAGIEDGATKNLLAASQTMLSAKVDPCAVLEAACVAAARSACEVVLRATLAKQTIHHGGAAWNTAPQLSETEQAVLFAAQERSAPRRADVDEIARRAVNLFRELLVESADDSERDRPADEQPRHLVVVPGLEPVLISDPELLTQLGHHGRESAVVGDRVLAPVVDELGHGDLPSVGAQASEAPDAASPTVGAPTDTSAVPSAVDVSVDEAEQIRLLSHDLEWVLTPRRATPTEVARELVALGWRTQR